MAAQLCVILIIMKLYTQNGWISKSCLRVSKGS
jgi:hypothetical protein